MDALDREIALRDWIDELVKDGKTVDEAEEIIQDNLEAVAQEVRDEQEG